MNFKKAVWALALAEALLTENTAAAQGSEAFRDVTQKSLNYYLAEGWKFMVMHYQAYGNGVESMRRALRASSPSSSSRCWQVLIHDH